MCFRRLNTCCLMKNMMNMALHSWIDLLFKPNNVTNVLLTILSYGPLLTLQRFIIGQEMVGWDSQVIYSRQYCF